MINKIQHVIDETIHVYQNEYIGFLQELVSFNSQIIENGKFGQEAEIQKYLAQKLTLMGAKVDVFEPNNENISKYPGFTLGHNYTNRGNVVGIFKGNGTGHSLLMNGHSDVVPAGDENLWSVPPFAGLLKDGRVFGRGTNDMKGGTAAAIMAIKLLLDQKLKFKGDVTVECVIDEEGGGNGTIDCCARGYRADGAIIMEPTNLAIMTANRGAFLAQFTVIGKPIHAAMKGFGVNAIEKAIKLINALKELESNWLLTKKHPLLSNPSINIGEIEGGNGASTVAGECTVKFDVEFLPSEYDNEYNLISISPNDVKREVEKCLSDACNGDDWLIDHPVQVKWYQETLCFETDSNNEFVRTMEKTCDKVLGKGLLDGLPCGCDGAQLANIGKMPVIIFGPGDLKRVHIIDESIPLENYLRAIEVYANLIVDWVGVY